MKQVRDGSFKAEVLGRVIVLDAIGRRPTVPALVQELIDDIGNDPPELAFECAVRDLDREGLISCRHGVVLPTADGFKARGEIPIDRRSELLLRAGGTDLRATRGVID